MKIRKAIRLAKEGNKVSRCPNPDSFYPKTRVLVVSKDEQQAVRVLVSERNKGSAYDVLITEDILSEEWEIEL